ncbi:MAG: M43 family zinc metalloprotease [Ferruginibacter sp.]
MKLLFSVFFAFLTGQAVHAQRDCGTTSYTLQYFKPELQKPGNIGGHDRDTIPNEIISIPVVVHLLYKTSEQNITDDQIRSQIDVINRDFRRLNEDAANTPAAFRTAAADTRIMFCLAQVDPTGHSTKGIVRKYTNNDFFLGDDGMKYSAAGGDNAWDSKKYLNIWVCTLFGRSLGYATIPGGPADLDGVVINYDVFGKTGFLRPPYDKGRTATHEIGHWLGLKHLWGDTNCGSDDVDDTPGQLSYNFHCPSFPHVTSCSPNSNGDMFMNFMDFTDDACMNMFSKGQKIKMRSMFALGASRNSFLNSFACDSTLATGGPLPEDTLVKEKPQPSVQVFPNPAQNVLNIIPLNDFELAGKSCEIFNIQGMRLLQQTLTSNKGKIDLSFLPAGIYILKIGFGTDKKILKIIKL